MLAPGPTLDMSVYRYISLDASYNAMHMYCLIVFLVLRYITRQIYIHNLHALCSHVICLYEYEIIIFE